MSLNWTDVDRLVQAHSIIEPTSSEESLLRQLRLWWCIKYNRPFKDPLLDTYTINDLVYEYLTWYYLDPENNPAEKKKKDLQKQDDEEWAKKQLLKVRATKPKEEPKKQEELPPIEIPLPPEITTKF